MIEKKDIINFLNEIFIPLGFKRKGNNWVHNCEVITKLINLQGSNYGGYYYINYGFIIRKLELTTQTHVTYRLAGNNFEENRRLSDLLDLTSNIKTEERFSELKKIISEEIINKIQSVNNEEELLEEIMKMPTLNIIPLIVKDHFKLS